MAESAFPTIPNPVVVPAVTLGRARRAMLPSALAEYTESGVDWAVNAAGQALMADKQTAWVQVGVQACMTERGQHPVFPRTFGWPIERALHQTTRALVEAEVERGISYAWLRCTSGRTLRVHDFTFTWEEADALTVAFTVEPQPGLGLQPVTLRVRY